MDNNTSESQVKLAKILKWALGLIGAVVISPVVFFAVKGLLGLALALAIGITTIQLAPAFSMKLANLKMKMIMSEASSNPIETMRNIYIDNIKIIQAKDEKIVQFEARLNDYKDKMQLFAKRYPEEVPRYQQVAENAERVLVRKKTKQRAAKLAAKAYKDNIDKAEAIYDMALAANEVTKLGNDKEQEVFQDIKKQVAFDSVNHSFNTAVAELAIEVDTEDDLALPTSPKTLPGA